MIINLQKIDIRMQVSILIIIDANKIQMTSGTYIPFYFLPNLTNGVDTLRLKSISEVRTSNGNAQSHNTNVTRGEGVSTAITTICTYWCDCTNTKFFK